HNTYHPYEQIHTILSRFEDAFPGWVEVITLGQSSQGRDIWAVKVSKPSSKAASSQDVHRSGGRGKFKFLVAGTQHSREWIAASTVLYLVHELVALDHEGKAPHRKLLEQVEFTFVPVVNPDGYVYAWEHDRLWRKSRQPVGRKSPQAQCLGIDLNRNWGYQFQPGARPNPCSDSYPGAKAFESVELQALRTYMLDGVDAFLDVHSFGQMLLFPYSYSCDVVTRDQENHYEAVLQAAKALRDVHGRVFETGSVCEVSLTSPGESLDWAYVVAKIRWSFATELRDGGIFGFLLPPAQIRPSGEEMSAALRRLTQFILDVRSLLFLFGVRFIWS
ncbi:peptidase M14, carboxypeptidase A, partial [Rhodotorula sp. JG-1b]